MVSGVGSGPTKGVVPGEPWKRDLISSWHLRHPSKQDSGEWAVRLEIVGNPDHNLTAPINLSRKSFAVAFRKLIDFHLPQHSGESLVLTLFCEKRITIFFQLLLCKVF